MDVFVGVWPRSSRRHAASPRPDRLWMDIGDPSPIGGEPSARPTSRTPAAPWASAHRRPKATSRRIPGVPWRLVFALPGTCADETRANRPPNRRASATARPGATSTSSRLGSPRATTTTCRRSVCRTTGGGGRSGTSHGPTGGCPRGYPSRPGSSRCRWPGRASPMTSCSTRPGLGHGRTGAPPDGPPVHGS